MILNVWYASYNYLSTKTNFMVLNNINRLFPYKLTNNNTGHENKKSNNRVNL